MYLLDLYVKNQIITCNATRPLVADSMGHAFVRFNFDAEWQGLTLTANFENNASENPVSVLITENTIEIPAEVLSPGYLQISVVGIANNGETKVPTAKMDGPIKVYEAGTDVGVDPAAITPELWEQVLAAIGQMSKLDTNAKNNLVAAINEVLRMANSGGGESGSGIDGVTFYPQVSTDGILSWTNNGGLANPEPVDIKGNDGKTPTFSVGIVKTVLPDAPANVTVTGSNENVVLNFEIPRGDVPVKGEDYLTEADIEMIVQRTIAAIPNGDEVEY